MTLKKKVGKSFVIFFIILIIMNILSVLITKKIDLEIIVVDILYILTLIWQLFRYITLKKRGVIQKQVRYVIERTNKRRTHYNTLYAYIKDNKGMEYKVHHNRLITDFENLPKKGFVDVIVDPNNYKNYFILIETVKGK